MKFLKEDCSSQNRLPIALTQVKADNTSESLFNESLQIYFSVVLKNGINKKVYNNTTELIQVLSYKIDTDLMNSENSKTFDPCRLVVSLTDKNI